jgi:cobalt/nickel transport system ATP-binding protein
MKYALEIKDLSFTYPDGARALDKITLQVRPKEKLAVIGPNGAGKSTFLLHMNGILPPSLDGNASICVDGVPVNKANIDRVRRRVGIVFQDPDDQLFSATVYDDVAFGPLNQGLSKEEIENRVAQSLNQAGVGTLAERSPHHLSFGERKRVCLAGILACEPEILALDEPTSNLDPRGRRECIELVQSLDRTIIVATHDLEMVVELCTRVIVLDGGKIYADGAPGEIMTKTDLMAEHGLEIPYSLR